MMINSKQNIEKTESLKLNAMSQNLAFFEIWTVTNSVIHTFTQDNQATDNQTVLISKTLFDSFTQI